MWCRQHGFDVRFGWGRQGLATLAPDSEVIVIVDVLSFSTGVSVAVEQGAAVFPCRWRDERAQLCPCKNLEGFPLIQSRF